jgi:putative ATPase
MLSPLAPLADRMRPRTLSEVVGQPDVAGDDAPLRHALGDGRPYSLVLWGPPGVGKTTIAMAIAHECDAAFEQLNAVRDGIRDLREIIRRARRRRQQNERTLLFIDEIARWNTAQQDALLPEIENGTVILVGATTENPGFELNRALLSRLKVEVLRALDDDDLRQLIDRALTDAERGLAPAVGSSRQPWTLTEEAIETLLGHADGDARAALGGLEAATTLQPEGGEITAELMARALGRRRFSYDKGKDTRYDMISALIKSIRGSDPDAALYWLARMEAGGEEPRFIARRLVVSASEDIGMAASGALTVATAGFDAVMQVGPPECWINLSHVVCYLATCPKNWTSYEGWHRARQLVEQRPQYPVPNQLRNAPTKLARELGHGEGYVHASRPGAEDVEFMPAELRNVQLYRPRGNERHVGWSRQQTSDTSRA